MKGITCERDQSALLALDLFPCLLTYSLTQAFGFSPRVHLVLSRLGMVEGPDKQ